MRRMLMLAVIAMAAMSSGCVDNDPGYYEYGYGYGYGSPYGYGYGASYSYGYYGYSYYGP
jgi:hypothetical protein